jgi:hypothetical protein
MTVLATIPNHSPTCSGCPACNSFAAKLLGMDSKGRSEFRTVANRALAAASREPTAGNPSSPSCACGGQRRGEPNSAPSAPAAPLPYTLALEAKHSPPEITFDPKRNGPEGYSRALAARRGQIPAPGLSPTSAALDAPQPYTRALERMRAAANQR